MHSKDLKIKVPGNNYFPWGSFEAFSMLREVRIVDARAGLVVSGLSLLLRPLRKCGEAERKASLCVLGCLVPSRLHGSSASRLEPVFSPPQSSVSSWVGCMRALLLSQQSPLPAAAVGRSGPWPSNLSPMRLFPVLFIMIVPAG